MGVMMQAFYWDCPSIEGKPFAWWKHIEAEVPRLAAAGFTALWPPPANKAANNISMGYDPYDFWDLGEFGQKGSVATWFGTRAELESLIEAAHGANMQIYADYVIDHCSGADAQEVSPVDGISRWTKFTPRSGKFPRDTHSFHPSRYETWDAMSFGGTPDLCHRNPAVYTAIIPRSSKTPSGWSTRSGSTVSASISSRDMAAGWCARSRNCADCAARRRSSR